MNVCLWKETSQVCIQIGILKSSLSALQLISFGPQTGNNFQIIKVPFFIWSDHILYIFNNKEVANNTYETKTDTLKMGMGYLTYPAATQIHIRVRGKNLLINNKLKKKKKQVNIHVYIFFGPQIFLQLSHVTLESRSYWNVLVTCKWSLFLVGPSTVCD